MSVSHHHVATHKPHTPSLPRHCWPQREPLGQAPEEGSEAPGQRHNSFCPLGEAGKVEVSLREKTLELGTQRAKF